MNYMIVTCEKHKCCNVLAMQPYCTIHFTSNHIPHKVIPRSIPKAALLVCTR